MSITGGCTVLGTRSVRRCFFGFEYASFCRSHCPWFFSPRRNPPCSFDPDLTIQRIEEPAVQVPLYSNSSHCQAQSKYVEPQSLSRQNTTDVWRARRFVINFSADLNFIDIVWKAGWIQYRGVYSPSSVGKKGRRSKLIVKRSLDRLKYVNTQDPHEDLSTEVEDSIKQWRRNGWL